MTDERGDLGGSATAVPGTADGPCGAGTVRILPADVRLPVQRGETVVDAVRRLGYRTRYSCRRGGCGACKAELVFGELRYCTPIAESVLSAAERAQGKCLPCRAQPVGDVAIRLDDRDQLRSVFGAIRPSTD